MPSEQPKFFINLGNGQACLGVADVVLSSLYAHGCQEISSRRFPYITEMSPCGTPDAPCDLFGSGSSFFYFFRELSMDTNFL